MSRRRLRASRIGLYALGTLLLVLAVVFVARRRSDIPLHELKARWATAPSRFLSVDGMNVHLRDEGTGPAILLLHGTSASLHTWDGWAASLRSANRVVRLDLPGFGLTGAHPSRDYSIEAYVSFLEHFVETTGVKRFVLAGSSLGGNIAWNYALAHPQRVRALVLVDSGGYPLSSAGRPIAFRFARWPVIPDLLLGLDPRRLVEDGLKKSYGDPSRIRPKILERYYELALGPGNRKAFLDRMRTPQPDASARIRGIKTPTLVLWGTLDRLIPVQAAHRFARDVAGSHLVVYDDLGHIPMEEDPQRTVADVQQFLSTLPSE
jgi:pimeloyl-ACP methyl ester carboxylesterase